jgi:hypothetical protein
MARMSDTAPFDDPMLARIAEAYGRFVTGDRPGARAAFDALSVELGPEGDALHRCVLAHYAADAQEDPEAELAWDLAALEAHGAIAADRVMPGGLAPIGFVPSLELNVAESYRRLGRLDEARRHADRAEASGGALGTDGYGAMIRGGIARLRERLSAQA